MKKNFLNIHFRDHFLAYTLVPLIVLIIVISYTRFILKSNYLVGYEGICDPTLNECFIGCEDNNCTTEYYYSKMIKYTPDLYKECGKDITDCEEANTCLPDDYKCSILYCDSEIDGNVCAMFTKETEIKVNNQLENIEDKILENNNIINTNI